MIKVEKGTVMAMAQQENCLQSIQRLQSAFTRH